MATVDLYEDGAGQLYLQSIEQGLTACNAEISPDSFADDAAGLVAGDWDKNYLWYSTDDELATDDNGYFTGGFVIVGVNEEHPADEPLVLASGLSWVARWQDGVVTLTDGYTNGSRPGFAASKYLELPDED